MSQPLGDNNMQLPLSRRLLLASAAGAALPLPALAAQDSATIGWPSDVTGWDPTLRFTPDAQGIYKMVFDQPLTQSPDLKLIANVVSKWQLAPDGKSLDLELRDDVTFHDGTKMTSEDIRYSFFERVKNGENLDIGKSFRTLTDVETPSPTHAVMRFSQPFPTAPVWLAFLGSFVVPKEYMSKVGAAEFQKKPVGVRPLQARGIRDQRPHRARAQRHVLGPEARLAPHHHRDHQGPLGACRRHPVRPGRPHHQRAGARGAAPRQGLGSDVGARPDHPHHPAAGAQRPRLR